MLDKGFCGAFKQNTGCLVYGKVLKVEEADNILTVLKFQGPEFGPPLGSLAPKELCATGIDKFLQSDFVERVCIFAPFQLKALGSDDSTQIACLLQESEYCCRSALVESKLVSLAPSASMADIERLFPPFKQEDTSESVAGMSQARDDAANGKLLELVRQLSKVKGNSQMMSLKEPRR